MSKINQYPYAQTISGKSSLTGTDVLDSNNTKQFLIEDLANYINQSSVVTSFNGLTGDVILNKGTGINIDSLGGGNLQVYIDSSSNLVSIITGGDSQQLYGDVSLTSSDLSITASGNNAVLDLNTTGITAGEYVIPTMTVNSKGIITAISGGVSPTGTVTSVAAALPLTISGDPAVNPTVNMPEASSTVDGYLSSSDWNTFNGKQNALTLGDLTEATSSVLTIIGGTGSIIGSGLSIEVDQADASNNGYLLSTDWNTFNGKQNAVTLTTTGTSGVATFVGDTLNIPNYSSVDLAIGDTVTSSLVDKVLITDSSGNLANTSAFVLDGDSVEVAGQFSSGLSVQSTGGPNLNINCENGNVFEIDLQGAAIPTSFNFTNAKLGGTYMVKIINNDLGTGNLNFDSSILFPGGTDMTLTSTANAIDVLTVTCTNATGGSEEYLANFSNDYQ